MAEIQTLPALDRNHPLFDWDDHQTSYNALVSGGQCAEFQKETWNAIVDALHDALTSAGLEWDSHYATYEGAHITDRYGALSAAAFNATRANIGVLFGIGWGWAVDPTFRGYVGRTDFKGLASGDADDIYPEYFFEITRGLNLFLEVLRGTADMAYGAHQHDISVPWESDLLVRRSAPMAFADSSESDVHGGAVARPSAPLAYSDGAFSDYAANLRKCLSGVLGDFRYRSRSQHSATAFARIVSVLRYTGHLAKSDVSAAMDMFNALYLESRFGSFSIEQGGGVSLPSVPVSWSGISTATQSGEIATPEAKPIQGTYRAKTAHNAAILPREPIGVGGGDLSVTGHIAVPDKLFPCYIGASAQSNSAANVVIDSAWYPPVWVDDTLWIRQTHIATQNGDTLEVN